MLLAAARRVGKELARLRTGEDEPAPESVRESIRNVISHCTYGVDRNPLAVDLCHVALRLESHTAGEPLTFLDHRIRCGDSLVGAFELGIFAQGIPDKRATSGLQPSSKRWLPILLSSPPPGSPTTSAAGPSTHGFMAALGRSPSVNRSATGRWSFLKFLPEAASTSCSATDGRGYWSDANIAVGPRPGINKHRSWIQTAGSA
jgi:hypothetical protein